MLKQVFIIFFQFPADTTQGFGRDLKVRCQVFDGGSLKNMGIALPDFDIAFFRSMGIGIDKALIYFGIQQFGYVEKIAAVFSDKSIQRFISNQIDFAFAQGDDIYTGNFFQPERAIVAHE